MRSDRIWPLGIVIAMTVFVAGMLAVVTVSFQHRPQLTTENYYAEGANLRAVYERKQANAATGWRVQVQPLPVVAGELPLIELTVTNASGVACDSLTGSVAFYRPSDQALDIESSSIVSAGAGKYRVKLPRVLERGSWQAVTHLQRGQQSFDTRANFFVEQ